MTNKVKHTAIALIAAASLSAATPGIADQYLVTLNAPMEGVSDRLLRTLKIDVLDKMSHDDQHIVVLEAPSDAYLETFFNTTSITPVALDHLSVDWTSPAMAGIDTVAKLRFGAPMACGFCAG